MCSSLRAHCRFTTRALLVLLCYFVDARQISNQENEQGACPLTPRRRRRRTVRAFVAPLALRQGGAQRDSYLNRTILSTAVSKMGRAGSRHSLACASDNNFF